MFPALLRSFAAVFARRRPERILLPESFQRTSQTAHSSIGAADFPELQVVSSEPNKKEKKITVSTPCWWANDAVCTLQRQELVAVSHRWKVERGHGGKWTAR